MAIFGLCSGVFRRSARAALALVLGAAAFGVSAAHAEAPEDEEKPRKRDTEFTLVPFVGGDSDVGLGGGYLASLARVDPEYEPYLMRVESASSLTFKGKPGGGVQIPYVDSYLLLDLPNVIKDRLRLEFRVSYTREATLKYYGIGNAATVPDGRDPNSEYFEHMRVHPTARVRVKYSLSPSLLLTWGIAYTHNWIELPEESLLAEDMQGEDETVRRLLGDARNHGVLEHSYGVAWDTRDDEVATQRGQYHTLRVDLNPGGYGEFPHRWARLDLATRFYATLIPRRLTFAMRLISDLLFGAPPFYELPRYDDTSAIGGAKGVRGIPAQRYYGKLKLLSNTELRSELFDFRLFGKQNTFGITGFVDAGRLWSDYAVHRELDGTGLGIKIGAGGGVRIRAGESFVLRIDAAWSRDASPIGAYLASGHVF